SRDQRDWLNFRWNSSGIVRWQSTDRSRQQIRALLQYVRYWQARRGLSVRVLRLLLHRIPENRSNRIVSLLVLGLGIFMRYRPKSSLKNLSIPLPLRAP